MNYDPTFSKAPRPREIVNDVVVNPVPVSLFAVCPLPRGKPGRRFRSEFGDRT